jgi:hypothetical protein
MAKATTTNVTRKNARHIVASKLAEATEAPVAPRAAHAFNEADVARRAYELYLQEGRPEGRQLEHWLQAEAELRTRPGNA